MFVVCVGSDIHNESIKKIVYLIMNVSFIYVLEIIQAAIIVHSSFPHFDQLKTGHGQRI